MNKQRHWKNMTEPGGAAFITTAVLDFVPAFADPVVATRMRDLLFEIHKHCNAHLFGFVIMPEHLHLITQLPRCMDDSEFMRRLKAYSAKALIPLLDVRTRDRLSSQAGLNQRQFWQRSFRAFEIVKKEVFLQKLNYIHQNPVRRGLTAVAEQYEWSSAKMYLNGEVDSDGALVSRERSLNRRTS